ncbi:MAG TPA: LysM peptidoglycan-binding domain-containing protein [Phycisphaerales bacterium]|nr:LysM peptidoglycan-binding domain-containing protein [Phycisphaerales bacterium]HMP36118.1 LysM peptidoglycan-binding domain-containing protein [Phycisphaerales bacterium]
MTRESKLALVVGFGLVLFVGILVADQISAVHRPRNADLLDPLLAGSAPARGISELGDPPRNLLVAPGGAAGREREAERQEHAQRDLRSPLVRVPDEPSAPTPDDMLVRRQDGGAGRHPGELIPELVIDPLRAPRTHVVQRGETLFGIAQATLGDSGRWKEILEANGISDPRQLRAGMELRLPPAQRSATRAGVERVALNGGRAAESETAYTDYTVRQGDTLSSIARERLGGTSAWTTLYELNRDRLRSPNEVRPGTVIRIPTQRSRASSRA